MATGGLYGNSGTGALIAQPGAETPGLYGKSPNGSVVAQPGSESAGLYGNGTTFGGYYFEWFVFQTSATQPATPTGGSWNFQTDSGTAPSGWTNAPASNPTNPVWISIALVNSRSTSPLVWSTPGVLSYSGTINGSGAPTSGVGQIGELYIQTGVTPNALWFKSGSTTWTQITGSALYVDLTSSQTIAGTKTFSSTIQGNISGNAGTVTNGVYTNGTYVDPSWIASLAGSKITGNISGNAANVTGTVAIVNGGTGATTASGARTNLGLGTIATQDASSVAITGGSITGITDLAIADGGTGASTAGQARINLGLGTAAVLDAGVANGVATLDAGGTVPLSQIPASIQGGVSYQGAWNASTNSPTLTSSVGTKGYYYVVSVAGSTNLNGVTSWNIGDWAIFNGTAWEKIDNTDAVTSVNGYTGTVVLGASDVGAVPTSRTISAGTGLSGGGDLSANRTLAIANSGVSSATYGSSTTVPVIAVNAQGQITSATNVAITGTGTPAAGYYGAFSDFTNQTAASTTTAYLMTFNTTDASGGVTIVSGSRITFLQAATYNIQWSGQFVNSATQDEDVNVWVRINGVDVTGSTGKISIPAKHGGVNGHTIASWNYVFTLNTNDYVQFVWNTTSTSVSIETFASGTSPTRPSTASLILTAQQITNTIPSAPTGAAGGALSGTYPNPSLAPINNTSIGATTPSTGRFSDLTDTGLTSGRVIYASTGGNLVDSANLTFNGTTLVANDFTDSSLTATRVVYAGTGGNLVNASNFTYDGTNLVAGAIQNTPIGATTPAAGTFTTLTAQTEVLKGTGQNLLLRSQALTTAPWALNLAPTTGSTTDPLGGSTATQFTTSTAGSGVFQTLTGASGVTYTWSMYIKYISGDGTIKIGNDLAPNTATVVFNSSAGTITSSGAGLIATSVTNAGSGWYRVSGTFISTGTPMAVIIYANNANAMSWAAWGVQYEIGSTLNTYIPTTTTAVYGTPTLSFSGVSTIGLQSDGSLYVSPAGTGALQAQATTSSATGGNARGVNAVDWQTLRGSASSVASGAYSVVGGGYNNASSGFASNIAGGYANTSNNFTSFVGGGQSNTASNQGASISGGASNTASNWMSTLGGGYGNTSGGAFNFIGGGQANSGTANGAVTTQSGTMNATTAVTLSGSNASIKVGQYITGTSIATNTYVAAISGTSLTLSQVASGSSTSTLSFFTPHGVVVGGGNNQATGSYSFIGGGGDAGTAGNRNSVTSDWGVVVGGFKNTIPATGIANTIGGGYGNTISSNTYGSVIGGGGTYNGSLNPNTISSSAAVIAGGINNSNSSFVGFIGGGFNNNASGSDYATIVNGQGNTANSSYSFISGGYGGTTRGVIGYHVFPASNAPVSTTQGVQQASLLVLGVQTTDATATVLRSNQSAAGTTNQIILPNNSAYYFKGSIIANVTGAANGAAWDFTGAIMRGANAASTVLIGTPAINRVAATAGATAWVIALTADTTNGGLAVTVTGAASTTIRWVCKAETTETTF